MEGGKLGEDKIGGIYHFSLFCLRDKIGGIYQC
jgi:hypothetical protein